MRITDRVGIALAAAAALMLAGTAQALPQFAPSATAKAHTVFSGEAGFTWNTGGLDVNGQIQYVDATNTLSIAGHIDAANYYDPLNGSCPTDSGSNCSFNYGPDLNLSVLAQFIGVTVTPITGGYDIVLDFQTAGGTDITWTDPADGNSVMLAASWTSGTFNSSPTPGLQVVSTYCTGAGCDADPNIGGDQTGLQGDPLAIGFALIDNSSLYANLFDSDGNPLTNNSIMLDFSELFDFNPDINTIAAYVIANNDLPDFTGEGEGQLYRVDTGDFVIPEPSTALMFGLGIAGLGMVRRRNQRQAA